MHYKIHKENTDTLIYNISLHIIDYIRGSDYNQSATFGAKVVGIILLQFQSQMLNATVKRAPEPI